MRYLVALLIVLTALPAGAQVYRYVDENGITVITNVPPRDGRYQLENLGCYGTCITGVDWHRTPLKRSQFREETQAAAEIFNLDEALVRAVMHAESWFNPKAVSSAGAQGLMQLMPDTQARFGVVDPFDPLDNIVAGTAYLAWLFEEFQGDLDRVVAAYNAGENAVRRHNGIPPFSETLEYVRRVRILLQRYRG